MPNDTIPLPEPHKIKAADGDTVLVYGEYAMHAHAAAVSAAKDAEIAALRAEYERACKLVADMHAAAMGAKVGPLLDVVGDVAAVVHKNTALQERIKVLEDAIQHYEAALKARWPEGAKGESFWHWNAARAALEQTGHNDRVKRAGTAPLEQRG